VRSPSDETDSPSDETDSPSDETDSPSDETDSPSDETDSPFVYRPFCGLVFKYPNCLNILSLFIYLRTVLRLQENTSLTC